MLQLFSNKDICTDILKETTGFESSTKHKKINDKLNHHAASVFKEKEQSTFSRYIIEDFHQNYQTSERIEAKPSFSKVLGVLYTVRKYLHMIFELVLNSIEFVLCIN